MLDHRVGRRLDDLFGIDEKHASADQDILVLIVHGTHLHLFSPFQVLWTLSSEAEKRGMINSRLMSANAITKS